MTRKMKNKKSRTPLKQLDGSVLCEACGWSLKTDILGCKVHHACGGPRMEKRSRSRGPGTLLHEMILQWLGEGFRDGCGCEDMVWAMNAGGPDWCRANLGRIADKMVDTAVKRGWRLARLRMPAKLVAKAMIRRAIRLAESEPVKASRDAGP